MLSRHLWLQDGHRLNLYKPLTLPEDELALLTEALAAITDAAGLPQAGKLLSPHRHWLHERPQEDLDPTFLVERAPARVEWEQLPCLPHTTQERVKLLEELNPPGRWLALGDDDLQSLACPRLEVLEADPFLVDRLPNARWHDLQDPVPEPGAFSLVTCDPPYRAVGMQQFLKRAHEALEPGGLLVLHTCPDLLEAPLDLTGFTLQKHQPAFSRYPAPEGFRTELRRYLESFDLPRELTGELTALPYLYGDLFLLTSG